MNGTVCFIFLLTLLVALASCSSVETFDASIVGFEETSSRGVPSLHGLKLDPPSSTDGPLAIRFDLCERLWGQKCEVATFLSTDKPGTYRIVNLDSGGTMLSAKDLRVGQQILVNYAMRGDLEPQTLTIKDYLPPNRFLRLTIKMTLPKETEQRTLPKSIESLIIAQLSWRLPPDIGIVQDTQMAENVAVIGDLDVTYSQFEVDTQWMMRDKRTVEWVTLKTRLLDPKSSTNWADLRVSGGSQPLGNDAFSYAHESAMKHVPMFEIRSTN